MHGQDRHDNVEGPIGEGQRFCSSLDDRGGVRWALSQHHRRGLNGDNGTLRWFVGASAGTDVQEPAGTECLVESSFEAGISLASTCVADADLVVGGPWIAHGSCVRLSTSSRIDSPRTTDTTTVLFIDDMVAERLDRWSRREPVGDLLHRLWHGVALGGTRVVGSPCG